MKERIRQLMLDQGMTQKNFAAELCIAEATLSGIFNGRTRPTNLTVNAIHERFPEVNISWLMFGEGEMYVEGKHGQSSEEETSGANSSGGSVGNEADLLSMPYANSSMLGGNGHVVEVAGAGDHNMHMIADGGLQNGGQPVMPKIQYVEKFIERPQRKITEIRIFFDDGTFETFTP